jgi:hypothetical protein
MGVAELRLLPARRKPQRRATEISAHRVSRSSTGLPNRGTSTGQASLLAGSRAAATSTPRAHRKVAEDITPRHPVDRRAVEVEAVLPAAVAAATTAAATTAAATVVAVAEATVPMAEATERATAEAAGNPTCNDFPQRPGWDRGPPGPFFS